MSEPHELEERLANLISDSIQPRLVPELEVLPWRHTHVLAVVVYPSPSRPHFLKKEGAERGVYVRLGSTNRHADRELIEEMRRFARGEAYDEQAMPELNSEAIDFRAASESFAEVRTLKRGDLETLRLVTTHQRRKVPTVGGMLLFGKERARYFPDAWIQVGRFAGTDKSHISDHAEIKTYPVASIVEAIAFVQKHAWHGAETHSDYAQKGAPIRVSIFDDRTEVESPGLLPFGLTVDDLHHGISKLRNRVIGRVFHELGLIEQWGSGVQRMTQACRDAGLAAPVLEEIGARFRVTLKSTRIGNPRVDPVNQRILETLTDRTEGCSTQELATTIHLTPRATRTRLVKLIAAGLVREIGSGPQDPKRRYFLAR